MVEFTEYSEETRNSTCWEETIQYYVKNDLPCCFFLLLFFSSSSSSCLHVFNAYFYRDGSEMFFIHFFSIIYFSHGLLIN